MYFIRAGARQRTVRRRACRACGRPGLTNPANAVARGDRSPPSSCTGPRRAGPRRLMSLRLGFDIDGVLADFRSRVPRDGGAPRPRQRRRRRSRRLGEPRVGAVARRRAPACGSTSRGRRTGGWRSTPTSRIRSRGCTSLSRAAGWEVFFLTKRPASAGGLGAVPDPVVDRAVRLLPAGGADRARLARRHRQRAAARPDRRRSADQLRRGRERVADQGDPDAARAAMRRRAITRPAAASASSPPSPTRSA